jgi:UDP-glucose 4-epimerase
VTAARDVLITGAGGFVGSALAEGFLALGWRVTAVDRTFDAATSARLSGSCQVTADLAHGDSSDLPAATVVVHAAAVTTEAATLGWTPAAHIAANTRPLIAMLEHAARTRPDAFVFVSSSGVFAAGDGDGVLTDADVPTGRSPYAAAKRAGELLTRAALEGIAAAHVIRLGYLYGPHETTRPSRSRTSAVARWLAAARAGQPLAVPSDDPPRDWTFTTDLAPAVARLVALRPADHPVHLCSPFIVKDSAMAARIAVHVPGAVWVTEPAAAPAKLPMRPSDLSRLGYLRWTEPDAALAQLAATQGIA